MSAYTITDVQTVYSGSNLTSYFTCNDADLIGLQITNKLTGAFIQAWRLEVSNFTTTGDQAPFTGSAHNGKWAVVEGPHSASLLTGSATQASMLHNIGNVGAKHIRAIIPVYISDEFTLIWQGKRG